MYLLVPLQIDPEIDKAQYIFYKSNTFKNQKNGKELLLTHNSLIASSAPCSKINRKRMKGQDIYLCKL